MELSHIDLAVQQIEKLSVKDFFFEQKSNQKAIVRCSADLRFFSKQSWDAKDLWMCDF